VGSSARLQARPLHRTLVLGCPVKEEEEDEEVEKESLEGGGVLDTCMYVT